MQSRIALLTLLLAGCAAAPVAPVPTVVRVPVATPAPIPAGLTDPCPVAQPVDDTVGEAVRVAQARGLALTQCANTKLKAIRELGEKQP